MVERETNEGTSERMNTKTLLNLDPLSEVTQLNNYSYHEANEETASDFIHTRFYYFSSAFQAAKLPRQSERCEKGGSC